VGSDSNGNEKVKKDRPTNITMYHWKDDDKMSDVDMATIQLGGEKQNFILNKKDFKTGSKGYHAQGKMEANGKRFQVNILVVEIGSKPKEK